MRSFLAGWQGYLQADAASNYDGLYRQQTEIFDVAVRYARAHARRKFFDAAKAAEKNGQRVLVGLGRGNDLNLTFNGFNDPQRNAAALAHADTNGGARP